MLSEKTKQHLILSLLGISEAEGDSKLTTNSMIGRVCLFRTYSAGVHFGVLAEKEGQSYLLKDAKRIYYWTKACSLSQLAVDGSGNSKECKISVSVPEIQLEQVIEIIPMSEAAIKNLSEHIWKK